MSDEPSILTQEDLILALSSVENWKFQTEPCFGCGKEIYPHEFASPMRCYECVMNKVSVQTSPVSNAFFMLKETQE